MNSSGITIITSNPSDFENLKKFFLEALESDPLAFSVTFSEYRNCDDVW